MRFVPFSPRPPLNRHVELIWVLQGVAGYELEKVLPNGVVELIVNLGAPHRVVDEADPRRFRRYRRAWLAGMQERPLVIQAERESDLVGIRFRAGGLRAFFGAPAEDLSNRVTELDEILDRSVESLRERLEEAATAPGKAALLEAFLLERLGSLPDRDAWIDWTVDRLRTSVRPPAIEELRRRTGYSHRHFLTRFRAAVGVNPKLLSRIYRFQRAIRAANDPRCRSWVEVAHACGYADQAHLIREFRTLAGAAPGEYLARRDADENHMILA